MSRTWVVSRLPVILLGLLLCSSQVFCGGGVAVIVIDPGHPSETSAGTRSADGTTENDVNWDVALSLRERLASIPDLKIILTKSSRNELVTNRRRAEMANEAGACLLLRLHCDSGKKRGFTLYYPDRAGTTVGVTGPSPEICRQSGIATNNMHAAMRRELAGMFPDNGVHTDSETYVGSRQGALTGSIHSRVPVVTVEMFFMSSAEDMAMYHSPRGKSALVDSLANGIREYLSARQVLAP